MIAEQQTPDADIQPSTSSTALAMNELVSELFNRLDGQGIPYCLLRNRDRIPDGLVTGSAVCLLVHEQLGMDDFIALVADFGPRQIVTQRDGLTTLFFGVDQRMLRIDVYTGDISWRGAVIRNGRDILAARRDDNGMMVASPVDQAFIAWLERLVRGKSKPADIPFIVDTIQANEAAFRRLAADAFGSDMAERLMGFVSNERLGESRSLVKDVRRALWRNSLQKAPAKSFTGAFRHGMSAVRNLVRPAGLNVVLLGPDGAGKTTLGSSLALQPAGVMPFTAVEHVWFSHRILPTWNVVRSWVRRNRAPSRQVAVDPYRKPRLHPVVWLTYQAYKTLNFWLCELTLIRRSRAHAKLVIHDRHPLEVTLDPRRYRYTGPLVFARWMSNLSPKPELVIVLDADPEIIQMRKQEVTLEETRRQMEAYRTFAASTPHAYLVDATRPAEEVVDQVVALLTEHVSRRTRARFSFPASQESRGSHLRLVDQPAVKAANQ